MKIVIKNKNEYKESFIKTYLKQYMSDMLEMYYDHSKASGLSRELKLNVYKILDYAINTLNITESGNNWIIEINKNLRYNIYNLNYLINYITYGNRSIKGYKILYIIFANISKNIDSIYKEWLDGS